MGEGPSVAGEKRRAAESRNWGGEGAGLRLSFGKGKRHYSKCLIVI